MKPIDRSFLLLLFLFSIVITISNVAQNKEKMTFEQYLNLNVPSSVTISPDGKFVVYTIRKADTDVSKWNTQVYIFNTATKVSRRFTLAGKSCTNPAFTPDGKFVSFLSSREYLNTSGKTEEGAQQLWLAPMEGGEAFNITSLPNGVEEYVFSEDAKWVVVLTEFFDEEKDAEISRNRKRKNDEQVFPKVNPPKELCFISVPDGKIHQAYKLDAGAQNIAVSPDAEKVVYQSNRTCEYNDDQKHDIYVINRAGKIEQITAFEGPETKPVFSPDGKLIAIRTQTVPDIEFAESDITLISPEGKLIKNLTTNFHYSVTNFIWKTNTVLTVNVNEGMVNRLYNIDIEKEVITPISGSSISVTDFSYTSKGVLCYRGESSVTLPEIYFEGKQITDFSGQLEKFEVGTQEIVKYKSSDGKFDLEGILFKPANFDEKKKYPLILTVHGGPYGHFRNTFLQSYPVRQYNNEGYLVFAPNPRGSSGYSDEFSQANRYDLGGGDYRDIMDGVDFIISRGFVDENKLGVTGGSYGGYLTNWIISQNNRFRAAVSLYGIFSYFTDWSNSWQPAFEKMYFGYYYWEKPIDMSNLYVSRSPAFYVKNIKTPTLILQGEKDVYTDVANSREMYQALKTLGVPVEFVLYPREGHGIRNEPNHYINSVERSVKWFVKYLSEK